MSADRDLAQEAIAHLKKTTIAYQHWLRNADLLGKPYVDKSRWGKAFAALERIGKPAPPPPSSLIVQAKSVIFCAGNAATVLNASPKYRVSLSADPGVRIGQNYEWLVAALREKGVPGISAWCDCRLPGDPYTGTPPQAAFDLMHELGLDYVIGEGESAFEFDNAYQAGMRVIIGNLSALRADQKARIASGEVVWIQEDYLNMDHSLVPDWQHLPVAASCVGMFDEGDGYLPLQTYIDRGRFGDGDGLWYSGGMRQADWSVLPA